MPARLLPRDVHRRGQGLRLHDAAVCGGARDAVVAAFSVAAPGAPPARPAPVDVAFTMLRVAWRLPGAETPGDLVALATYCPHIESIAFTNFRNTDPNIDKGFYGNISSLIQYILFSCKI